MNIKWIGHSCFQLAENKKVLIDPFISQNPVASKEDAGIDIIAVTHGHSDHLGDTVELAKIHN